MTVIPGRATPFRRFGLLPQAPISRPPHEPTPPVAVIAPDAPPIVLTPAAPVAAPAVAPAAPLTTRIPNRQPAPAGVDKWQHNNALALGVLTGSETPEQRAEKIKEYMKKAGATGTDEAAFTAQLRKDAIAVQQLLKSQGLPVGTIDGKLGDISAAAIEAGRQRLPEAARDTPTIDLLRQAQAAAPAPAAPAAAAPVAVERPKMVIRQQGPRGP